MKILTNQKIIRRNAKIGQFTSLASLLILGGGMYVSFAYPTQLYISFVALFVGFILSQVGIFFGNRWGRHPRIDEKIDSALKGLTKDYTIFHFLAPVNHLMVGPAGIWILEPYYQRGKIVYKNGKWNQKGGGLFLGYLKIFAQEGLGRPDLEIKADIENLTRYFKKSFGEDQEIPVINIALLFTDPRVELKTEDSPIPTMMVEQFKEYIRKNAKQSTLPSEEIKRILSVLPSDGIE